MSHSDTLKLQFLTRLSPGNGNKLQMHFFAIYQFLITLTICSEYFPQLKAADTEFQIRCYLAVKTVSSIYIIQYLPYRWVTPITS